jgi:excinuclease UvrABC nuclease subunit
MIKKFSISFEANELVYNSDKLDGKSGCYILRSKEFKSGIKRFNSIDTNSILYIGKGDNIHKRVRSLIRSINDNDRNCLNGPHERGHKALSRKFYRIRNFIRTELLFIDIYTVNNINPKILESFLLETYVANFAELPPLNGQYGSFTLEQSIQKLDADFVSNFSF